MLKFLPVLAFLVSTPAAASTFHCVDPDGEVTLDFVENYDPGTGIHDLVSAKFQIVDDIGYTTAKDPNNDGDVTLINVDISGEVASFDMHLLNTEQGYDTIVGSIRLTRASEGSESATGGTIHIAGGGAWAIACTEAK